MKRIYSLLAVILVFFGTILHTRATHIVGAELYYECINPATNQYRVTLKMYRDCLAGQAPYDPNIVLFIFSSATGQVVRNVNIPVPPTTPVIQPENIDACVATPPQICVEEGIYTTVLQLPPLVGGYDLAWARCCRNAAIDNLATPLAEGITFLAHVPDPGDAACNTMPQFAQTPPIFLCANESFFFDHSAIDPDGDSLSYAITNPYTGINNQGLGVGNPNQGGPQPVTDPFNNPMGPPPYRTVNFAPGFRFTDPFGSGDFNIDPATGFISVTPNRAGIFVFSISVFEWRNGRLLSENRRDFQIHVLNCRPQGVPPLISHDLSGLNSRNDTIFIDANVPFCYNLTVQDQDPMDQLEAYTVSASFGRGTFIPPAATFEWSGINPIQGEICWRPSCAYDGQVVPLIIGARDVGDCPNISDVFDTVYVSISTPPNEPPEIIPDYSNLEFDNDTIVISAMNNFCFDFTVTDPNPNENINISPISPIFDAANGPTLSFSGRNPINGQVCWMPDCDLEGQVFELTFEARDLSRCTSALSTTSTTYVRVEVPENDPPSINRDFGSLASSGDTIFVQANADLCYQFEIVDPNLGDSLQVNILGSVLDGPNPPQFSISGNTAPVTGNICWTPGCDFTDQVIALEIVANDNGMCDNQATAQNITYISIAAPPNSPPTVNHDLSGLTFSNDTVYVFAEEELCYDLSFIDPDAGDSLTVDVLSSVFTNGGATFTPRNENNVVQGQVCWTPSCDFEGQVVPLLIRARDNGECNNILEAIDTVYVNIQVPPLTPPIVFSDLSSTNHNGDTIFIQVGDSVRYNFLVQDQTPETDIDYTFEFQNFGGTDAGLGVVDVQQSNGRIEGQVFFQSDCSNGGNLYRLIITGLDTRTCPPLVETKDTVFIKVNTNFEADAGPDISFCEGTGGIRLNAGQQNGGGAPYFYTWSCTAAPNCGFSNPNAQNPIVNPTGSTTFYLQVTDRFGCTSEFDSVTVGVDLLPEVSAGPDVSICEDGGEVQLEATVINAQDAPGPYTFQWLPAEGLNATNIPNPVASPTSTTIYSVIVSGSQGCTSQTTNLDTASTIEVRVAEQPISEAGTDLIICAGDSVQLNGFATRGGPNYTYQWTSIDNISNPTSQTPFVQPTQSTTYYLTASSNGCEGIRDSVFVDVKMLPTVNPGTNYEICATETLELNGTASGAAEESFTYLWSPNLAISNQFQAEITVDPDTATIYTLVATSNFGCTSLPYDVLVDVLPTPIANAGDDTFICREDSIRLNGSHIFLGRNPVAGNALYSWTPTASLSNPNISNPQASPFQTEVYTLVVSFGQCQTSDEVKIDVFNTITTNVSSDEDEICSSESVQLTAMGGTGSAFFSWSPANSLDNPNSSTPLASPDVTTTYYVTIEEGGCQARDSITINVNQTPIGNFFASADLSCVPLEISFMENTQNSLTYFWDFGDGNTSTDANPIHTYTTPGTYEVTLNASGEGGCNDTFIGTPIRVTEKGVADFTSTPNVGSSSVLPNVVIDFLDQSQFAEAYSWDFGDGNTSNEASPVHTYLAPGNYTVTLIITDAGGCMDTVAYGPYNIFSPDLFIPNVFSPNQDGINDTFKVRYSGKEFFFMEIVDRWGVKMFEESGNPASEWNGTTQGGGEAKEGVYYYLVKIGDKAYAGDLTLVR